MKTSIFNTGIFFDWVEHFSIAAFTFEYVVRLWICTLREKYKSPVKGRIKYILSPFALIDLLAVLPFFIPYFNHLDLRFVRTLRLFRFLRVFKLGRYFHALNTLGRVIVSKKHELIVSLMIVLLLLFFSSVIMFYFENEAQPEAFSSIPKSLWWGVATLTTVGYGDIYPITAMGRFLGAIISILGIGVFALPTGILASGFAEQLHREKKNIVCPHCNQEIES